MAVELYPHQLKAVKEMHNGSVLKGGVGTGKSITALYYFYTRVVHGRLKVSGAGETVAPSQPRDVVVITTARKRDELDWVKEAAGFAISTRREDSMAGIELTVDSWNNIARYLDRRDCFFIFDEQRLVGSGAWVKAFLAIAKANQWVMLSATPGDTWLDYIPVFIAHGYYKNRTEFLRRHVVFNNYGNFPKVDHYVEEGRLDKLRHQIVVDMPYARHTKRHVENVMVKHDEDKFRRVFKDRWNVFEERPIKDVGELLGAMRRVSNDNPHRLGAVMEVLEKHPKLIIFYNFNYELDMLRTLHDVLGVEVAEWNGHKHQEVPTGERWVYLVQYTSGSEAWNCVTTDAILFYSLNYSYRILEQSMGRIDRLNTEFVDLWYYIVRSGSFIDQQIMKALRKKENFNVGHFATQWT